MRLTAIVSNHAALVLGFVAWIPLVCCAVPYSNAKSTRALIANYTLAKCVPFAAKPTIVPRTRQWQSVLQLRDGSSVTVKGPQIPAGIVTVSFGTSDQPYVAANAGDYVYPTDIRIDPQAELLYIRADGLVAGITRETVLFEYDLRRRTLITRIRVQPTELPDECSDAPQ